MLKRDSTRVRDATKCGRTGEGSYGIITGHSVCGARRKLAARAGAVAYVHFLENLHKLRVRIVRHAAPEDLRDVQHGAFQECAGGVHAYKTTQKKENGRKAEYGRNADCPLHIRP